MQRYTSCKKGIVLMLLANAAFTIMVCLVRYGASSMPYTTTMFRFVIGIAIIGMIAMSGKSKLTFVNKKALFWRGCLGGMAICMSFISIMKIGIIKGSMITNTYPVFAALFSSFLLGEKISKTKITAISVAFAGMVLLFTGKSEHLLNGVTFYEFIGLAGAILGGFAVIFVKKLQKTDSTVSIYFAQCLIGLWIVIFPATTEYHSITTAGAAILMGVGVFATLGQLLFTAAYRYITVSTGSVLTMSGPMMTFFAGAVVFKEPLTLTMLVGCCVVVVSCVVVAIDSAPRPRVQV